MALLALENPKVQLKNGLEKCLKSAQKPRVLVIRPGVYRVFGDSGNEYQVRCLRDGSGVKFVECNCKGNARRLFCYHVAAAVLVHSSIVAPRREAAK